MHKTHMFWKASILSFKYFYSNNLNAVEPEVRLQYPEGNPYVLFSTLKKKIGIYISACHRSTAHHAFP